MARVQGRRRSAYTRDKAIGYDEKRARQAAWHTENAIIRKWSKSIPPGSTVLDVPCGTGRLLPFLFENGHRVTGVDLSEEMMAQIPRPLRGSPLLEGLERQSADDLPYADRRFDYVVSMRLFHLATVRKEDGARVPLIPKAQQARMLEEFMRVADKGVVLHVPLAERTWLTRAADNVWRALPWNDGALYVARRLYVWFRKRWEKFSRKASGHTKRSRPMLHEPWSMPELTKSFEQGGFRVMKAYGAISPISAKKIFIAERVAPSAPE